ncbi:HORMA domain-containing protein 1-like [Sphaeramia orbicularis]|uniref:HORMA domain-containing protein 1-like n=1 Tax=Sphaeramia orbicularis TaxID=375764 RepID=UPI00117FBA47|nr:HORMA domain-containing protein 1-like [Sphaeramia orbicularis]
MECLQKVRPAQDTQLLPNQVVGEQQSLTVIKKLLAIAVSGITYLRGLFPKKAYGTKHVEDQKVMILREEHSCPGATEIVQWMQGCFDAIQKKYLRTMILSIYTDPENPQKVTEFYQFRIQYTTNGAQMEFESNNNMVSTMSYGDTKRASVLLVRKLYTLMQNLGPLPDNVCLNMKLAYYNDVTPQDYQPPGFKNADGDTIEFGREPVKLAVGEVVAPFHALKLDMATERHRLEEVEESIHEMKRWFLKMEEGVLSQSYVTEEMEEPDTNSHMDASVTPDIELSCHEEIRTTVEITEVDTLLKDSAHMEVGQKRTRSGRIITSTTVDTPLKDSAHMEVGQKRSRSGRIITSAMVSEYEIPDSQEKLSTSSAKKKRKFSEPKDHY